MARGSMRLKDYQITISAPTQGETNTKRYGSKYLYGIHRTSNRITTDIGSRVCNLSGQMTTSLTAQLALILSVSQRIHPLHLVCSVLLFEFASCFWLSSNLTYQLAHTGEFRYLKGGIPSITSFWSLTLLLDHLERSQSSHFITCDSSGNALHACTLLLSWTALLGLTFLTTSRGQKQSITVLNLTFSVMWSEVLAWSSRTIWTKSIMFIKAPWDNPTSLRIITFCTPLNFCQLIQSMWSWRLYREAIST